MVRGFKEPRVTMRMLVIYAVLGVALITWTAAVSIISPHSLAWLVPPFP